MLGIGQYGIGTLNQSGGTISAVTLELGIYSSGSGTYNFSGGILKLQTSFYNSVNPFFNFGGGTLQATGNLSNIQIPITLSGLGGNSNIDTANYSFSISGILTGPGGLNKLGTGKLTLSASNTYSGSTTITAGSLALSSAEAIGGSNIINVNSGAVLDISALSTGFKLYSNQTLQGVGTIIGDLTVDGIHAPGSSPGIETVREITPCWGNCRSN